MLGWTAQGPGSLYTGEPWSPAAACQEGMWGDAKSLIFLLAQKPSTEGSGGVPDATQQGGRRVRTRTKTTCP